MTVVGFRGNEGGCDCSCSRLSVCASVNRLRQVTRNLTMCWLWEGGFGDVGEGIIRVGEIVLVEALVDVGSLEQPAAAV